MPTVKEILKTWDNSRPIVYIDNGETCKAYIDPEKLRTDAPDILGREVLESYSWMGKTIPLLKLYIGRE